MDAGLLSTTSDGVRRSFRVELRLLAGASATATGWVIAVVSPA